jgi:hypothetical protein
MRHSTLFTLSVVACLAAGGMIAGPARADQPPSVANSEAAATKALTATAAAETAADEVADFDKIRAPDSPAFAILGVSPSEIQRPTTPTEVSVALGSFVSAGSLVVPDSLAVEVAPYWLFAHPELTGEAMAESSPGQAMLRNFTVSLGSNTRTSSVEDGMGGMVEESETDLALGLRTRWLDGRKRVVCWADVEAAAQAIAEKQGTVLAAETVAIAARYPVQSIPDGASEAERRAVIKRNDAATKALEKEIDLVRAREFEKAAAERVQLSEVAAKCVEASAARTGLVGDVALAASFRFPERAFEDREWQAAGGWVTLAAQGKSHNLVGLARLLAEHEVEGNDRNLVADAGARYIHVRGRYALSTEVIYRYLTEDVPDQHLLRVGVSADVRVYGSGWVTATFGRDFAAPDAGEVFALANLKWGFGKPSVKLP